MSENIHYLHGGLAVECACRLVGEQDFRLCDDGSCDGYALFLSAGHLVGQMVRPVFQAHALELLHGKHITLLAGDALVVKRQRHILQRVLEIQEVETLEDKAY